MWGPVTSEASLEKVEISPGFLATEAHFLSCPDHHLLVNHARVGEGTKLTAAAPWPLTSSLDVSRVLMGSIKLGWQTCATLTSILLRKLQFLCSAQQQTSVLTLGGSNARPQFSGRN